MKKQLQENIDFYYNEQGYVVLTEHFHRERDIAAATDACIARLIMKTSP